jgi:hypothetical protein
MEPLKRLLIVLLATLGAAAYGAGCGNCESTCKKAGPEITSDYSARYLCSADTGRCYADPMYYVAKDALARWHRIRGKSAMTANAGRAAPRTRKAYASTVEK